MKGGEYATTSDMDDNWNVVVSVVNQGAEQKGREDSDYDKQNSCFRTDPFGR
jgi:hypothetical protein